jgi:response regulator RpfG family c-di-GMP phosphodiesterase
MVTDRTHQAAQTRQQARTELLACAGAQFDPAVVAAFLAVTDEPVEALALPKLL